MRIGADDPQLGAVMNDTDALEDIDGPVDESEFDETVIVVSPRLVKACAEIIIFAGVTAFAAALLVAAGGLARVAWYLLRLGWSF